MVSPRGIDVMIKGLLEVTVELDGCLYDDCNRDNGLAQTIKYTTEHY